MDEVFFASVLRKWAESSQLVVDLKKRLDDVESERNEYHSQITNLKGKAVIREATSETTPVPPECHDREENSMKLTEAGDRLERARSEYLRLRQQLQTSNARQSSFEREIEKLTQERAEFESQLLDLRTENVDYRSQISTLQTEKQRVSIEVVDLTARLHKCQHEITELKQCNEYTQVVQLQQVMNHLETQIHELQSSARNLEMENSTLRDELNITREALHKCKESNKSLLTTISKLSHIARNVVGVHEPASGSQPYHDTPTANPNNIVKTELASLRSLSSLRSHSSETPLKLPMKKEEYTESLLHDATLVAEPQTRRAQLDAGLLTPIPPHRRAALAVLSAIVPANEIKDEDNRFTRNFISSAIGGNIQSLIVRVTASSTELAKGRGIEEYLCPRLDHNPWCPSVPGQHGFMFVGLGKEKYTYATPQLRNLFVGMVKNSQKEERYFRYLGVYEVIRVDPLTSQEWQTLHPSVKANYVQATKDKNKDPRLKEAIAAAYDSGELSVPCVRLQCVDFDGELYTGLLARRAAAATDAKGRAAKRTRDGEPETDTNMQKCRRTRRHTSPSNESQQQGC